MKLSLDERESIFVSRSDIGVVIRGYILYIRRDRIKADGNWNPSRGIIDEV